MVTSSLYFVEPPANIVYFDCFGLIIKVGCSDGTTAESCFDSVHAGAGAAIASSSS